MENQNHIELSVNLASSTYRFHGIESNAKAGIPALCATLQALGMAVSVDESDPEAPRISIDFPDDYKAEKLRNRGGGRPRTDPWAGLDVSQMREEYDWYESHTPEEGAKRMGCSKRTYYRRIAQLRKQYEFWHNAIK